MVDEASLHVLVRKMSMADVEEVLSIDQIAFSSPWSRNTYTHEVNNKRSTMIVAKPYTRTQNSTQENIKGIKRLFQPPRPPEQNTNNILMGYSGFWHIVDEAHISTIAVHPDWRGHKIGELLIWIMARQALWQKAKMITLEVRISNTIAQNLYRKYGFEVAGRRKGYYRDNGEDAYLMTATPLDQMFRQRLVHHGRELAKKMRVTTVGLATRE